jgi:hypothetical protein
MKISLNTNNGTPFVVSLGRDSEGSFIRVSLETPPEEGESLYISPSEDDDEPSEKSVIKYFHELYLFGELIESPLLTLSIKTILEAYTLSK